MAGSSVITQGILPVPDPTVRTVEQLQREIAASREIIETRFGGMDKAIELLQKTTDKIPEHIKDSFLELRDLHQEKFTSIGNQMETRFDGIDTQFLERDKRTEQLSLADKTAIAAALQAQKEAAGAQNESNAASATKQEAAFTKLIDQTQTLLVTTAKSLDDKINDLKSRFDKGEGHTKGASDNWAFLFGIIGMGVGLVTVLVLLFKVVT